MQRNGHSIVIGVNQGIREKQEIKELIVNFNALNL